MTPVERIGFNRGFFLKNKQRIRSRHNILYDAHYLINESKMTYLTVSNFKQTSHDLTYSLTANSVIPMYSCLIILKVLFQPECLFAPSEWKCLIKLLI